MSYNSKNKIYFRKDGYSGKNLFGTTKGDKKSLIEKNRRIKILLSIAFFVFFSTSNFILQLSYALSTFIWSDAFHLILIPSFNLSTAVLNLISLIFFIIQDGIDQKLNFLFSLKFFATSVVIVLILFDILSLVIKKYLFPFSWICAFLSLLAFISSWIHGGYCCFKNKKNEEDSH
jgi:hypothetical protein